MVMLRRRSHHPTVIAKSVCVLPPLCTQGFGLNNHIITQRDSEKEVGVAVTSFKSEPSEDRTQEEKEKRQRGVTHDSLR